jgi:ABC-type Fe3+ transport system permease subunit
MIAERPDRFRSRDSTVTVAAYAAGTATAAAFVALAVGIATLVWTDLHYALSGLAHARAGVMLSLLVVAVALPATVVLAVPVAACADERSIGGAMRGAVLASLGWSLGMPPVVIGVAVFLIATAFAHTAGLAAAIAALIVLNVPNATARFLRAYGRVPDGLREAAAAAGASPVHTFFAVVQRRAALAVAAATLTIAAQMVGETSAILLASGARAVNEPLSLQIWQFASNAGLAQSEAASCLVLVAGVALCLVLAKLCAAKAA